MRLLNAKFYASRPGLWVSAGKLGYRPTMLVIHLLQTSERVMKLCVCLFIEFVCGIISYMKKASRDLQEKMESSWNKFNHNSNLLRDNLRWQLAFVDDRARLVIPLLSLCFIPKRCSLTAFVSCCYAIIPWPSNWSSQISLCSYQKRSVFFSKLLMEKKG